MGEYDPALKSSQQNTHMRRGRSPHAAGHAPTGTASILAPKFPSHFGTLYPKIAPYNLKKLDFAVRKIACCAGCRFSFSRISNRHLVQLEIAATLAKSTRSLFLIVTRHPLYTSTQHKSSETLVAQACPACVRFVFKLKHHSTISNRHLVQLEFVSSPVVSTSSLFLIDPKHTHFSPAPEAQ